MVRCDPCGPSEKGLRSHAFLGGRKGAQQGGHMPTVRSPLRSSQALQQHNCASHAFLRGPKGAQQGGYMPMVRFPLRSSWTIPESDRAPMRSSVAVKALSKADTCPWCDAIHAGLQKSDCAPMRSSGAVKALSKADTSPWCDPSPLLRFLLRSSRALQKNNCTSRVLPANSFPLPCFSPWL